MMYRTPVAHKRVTVLGAAKSGLAAARLLKRKDAEVFVSDHAAIRESDKRLLTEFGIEYEEQGHTGRSLEADFIVISPGVPDSAPIVKRAVDDSIPIYSEIELAWWFCTAKIVAITGSNGKTTSTFLTHHILNLAGLSAYLAGNIGIAFSDVADEVSSRDTVVLEVSSFQLDHVERFAPNIAAITNITPDHLNRYNNSFDEYASSKMRIAENIVEGGAFIYNADDPELAKRIKGVAARMYGVSIIDEVDSGAFLRNDNVILRTNSVETEICSRRSLSLAGEHNLYNGMLAALAAFLTDAGATPIREGLQSFEGVEHRMEFVREIGGVRFINDSKATNVDAVKYAIRSFDEPVTLIAGGRDKGNDYAELIEHARGRVSCLIAMGESRQKIASAFDGVVGTIEQVEGMYDAVRRAAANTQEGVVLLSPACASFDQYNNYEQRGNHFKQIVNDLTWAGNNG